MDGEQQPAGRAEVTRQRHGDDFYARIGRKSWELRRRGREGDVEALEILQRRRDARGQRRAIWHELLAAKEAVTILREELAARALANADPARSVLRTYFDYTGRLRTELARAEERLADLQAAHRRLLDDLKSDVAAEDDPPPADA
jgi:hypothetical protein